MAVCYIEVIDPQGWVRLEKGIATARSVPEGTDPEGFARDFLDAPGGAGWTCRVWIQDGLLPIPSGEPDAEVTA
jgi:hypothetical protein